MNIHEAIFPTIEYGSALPTHPFTTEDKRLMLRHIFNQDQINGMVDGIGKSIYFTHVFTEMVKARGMDKNFEEILKLKDSGPFD